ncbi:MAG: hypothetical protein DDT35_01389 [Firmicutes bacterium]|nr:hypothetical protein [Bacillota bacterium]
MNTFDYTEREILWTLQITTNRPRAIYTLEKTLSHTKDPLMAETSHGLLTKLRQMTDAEFDVADKHYPGWK